MPIRTDRGRAVLYRRFWGRPLRSPKCLALATVLGAAAVIGIALVTSPGAQPDPRPAPQPTSTPERPSRSSLSVMSSGPAPRTPARSDSAAAFPPWVTPPVSGTTIASRDATQAARAFAARWVTHPPGTTSRHWAAQLAPFVVPEYLATLESVDPSTIPASAVTGDPTVHLTSPTVVEATVPTDAGLLRLVLLAQPDGTWRVRSYDRAAS